MTAVEAAGIVTEAETAAEGAGAGKSAADSVVSVRIAVIAAEDVKVRKSVRIAENAAARRVGKIEGDVAMKRNIADAEGTTVRRALRPGCAM